ncbi:phosphate acyltransferase PlsX [Aminirod propionatiphilus]|uniref:Phosphate acyltransferase PlsX n=1 Tax=Aminirod propionatiphilus TaxID=3415223 RepID=A0ACD1DYX5_9BACT|nr:phosphate acyltransferase PlsX [Synergistota bacterium]
MLLALDVMGGDNAPAETCRGALMACDRFPDLEVALVGTGSRVAPLIAEASSSVAKRLHVVNAEEVITMDELPSVAIRNKRKSSLRIAMEMVRSGEAQCCISAGNTGAIVAGGVLVVGRIPGIDRPGLGVPLPAIDRLRMLIDVGATVRSKPLNLVQFALMGGLYMRHVLNVADPKVALLANGEEEIKGDDVIAQARDVLRKGPFTFIGYVEGKDIPVGPADVVVCDGFTGNILLKVMEGLGEAVYALLREEMGQRILPKVGMVFMLPMLKELWTRFDYEQYGGTPLLGVRGAVIKAHGRSKAPAIASALGVARDFVLKRGVELISREITQGGM